MLSVDKVRSAFFYVFLLVFVVDPVAFSLQLIGVPKIPFGLIGMAGAVLLVATQAVRAARKKISPNALALGCGYCLLMVMAVFSRYFEWPDVWMWVQNAAYYFVGAYAGAYFLKGRLGRRWQLVFLCSICLSGFLWFAFSDRIFVSQEIEKLNYLHVSDSIAVVSLVLLASVKSARLKLLLFVPVLLALYFVGSRFGLVASTVATLAMLLKEISWMWRASLAGAILIGGVGLVGYVDSLGLEVNDNRIVRLFLFTEDDTSLNARIEDDVFSRDVYLDSPLVGAGYKFYVVNGEGTYAHNALSVVYEFGFFGVLFLMAALSAVLIALMKTWGGRSAGGVLAIVVLLSLACFSKFYLWWGYFFYVGYLMALKENSREL